MTNIAHNFQQFPYVSYAYSYPHKTAYRRFDDPVPLKEAWATEATDALFLYLHIPFCEMRCGFCNLFTTANPREDVITAYLDAIGRQAREVSSSLGKATFARMAIGGGTPTFLSPLELERLFDIAEQSFDCCLADIPVSCETSPFTADEPRLRLLRERGIDRISIGVQSFVEVEAGAVGRSQKTRSVEYALERIRTAGFPVLNVDLMYGLPGQTVESWLGSLKAALRYQPEEFYLYPLYVRPLTGMGRHPKEWNDIRVACYRAGKSLLESAGYEQLSMRMFRSFSVDTRDDTVYCCQEDGMVGLGCGARSYTRELHYSNEYAVGSGNVHEIIARFVESPRAAFRFADYGFRLSADEQRRRFVIKSILRKDGLDVGGYRRRFGNDPHEDLPELNALLTADLAVSGDQSFKLSEAGMELSDAIGPWLYSPNVHELMRAYDLR